MRIKYNNLVKNHKRCRYSYIDYPLVSLSKYCCFFLLSLKFQLLGGLPCLPVKSPQLCLTLWDPMDCSPPGSSVHGILQARVLEWIAMPFSRGASWPRDWTCISCVSCIGKWVLYHWATWEALQIILCPKIPLCSKYSSLHLFLPPGNNWSFCCLHSFYYFRMSRSWNHTGWKPCFTG